LVQESVSAPWEYQKPSLDFDHKYRGYVNEVRSVGRSLAGIFGKKYTDPESRFVIFGRGRSGSTLLVRMLDQHDDIACFGELLRSRLIFPERYRDRCMRMSNKPVRGFKLLSYQMTQVMGISPLSGYLRGMQDDGFKIIYIHRENFLRLAISNMLARMRGTFHVASDSNAKAAEMAFNFPPAEIVNWMEGAERRTAEELQLLAGVDYFDVLYERDLEQPSWQMPTLGRLFRWLGVKEQDVGTDLVQATPRDLRKLIANFAEVEDAIASTPFARFLPQGK
jgi:hypothetical protein